MIRGPRPMRGDRFATRSHRMTTPSESEDVQRFDRWSSTYEASLLQRLIFDRVDGAIPS
jgi:hypothetical protein